MSPRDRRTIRRVLDDVAQAVQRAMGLATHLRRETQNAADVAVALESAIGRAVAALERLQPGRKDRS